MAKLTIKPKSECRWDCVSLGEIMLRLDPGEGRIKTACGFRVWEGGQLRCCPRRPGNDDPRKHFDSLLSGGGKTVSRSQRPGGTVRGGRLPRNFYKEGIYRKMFYIEGIEHSADLFHRGGKNRVINIHPVRKVPAAVHCRRGVDYISIDRMGIEPGKKQLGPRFFPWPHKKYHFRTV